MSNNLSPLLKSAIERLHSLDDQEFRTLKDALSSANYFTSDEHIVRVIAGVVPDLEEAEHLSGFIVAFARLEHESEKTRRRTLSRMISSDNLSFSDDQLDELRRRVKSLTEIPQIVAAGEASRAERSGAHHLHSLTLDSSFKVATTNKDLSPNLVLQHEMTIRYGSPFSDQDESVSIVIPRFALKDFIEQAQNAQKLADDFPAELRELGVKVWADEAAEEE